jgi:2-polyprenyl-3-methyl-5-hydroxy-6-metoxy-1,4-benzoquinol methylase
MAEYSAVNIRRNDTEGPMRVKDGHEGKYPSTVSGVILPCPLCGSAGNNIAVFEDSIEHRFGMPVLPVADYGQALCRKCGLLYVNASVDSAYLVKLYSQESVTWQHEYVTQATPWNGGTTAEEHRRFSTIIEIVAKHRDVRGLRWLDFGCQTGELGDICRREHSVRMFGVDLSEDYVKRADTLWGGDNSVRTSIGSFLRDGERFDVISAIETLEHIPKPWETVDSFRQGLSPGGLLVVTVPSAQYFRLKFQVFKAFRSVFSRRLMRERSGNNARSIFGLCHTHPYNFSPASLSELLNKSGFSVTYLGGIGWSTRFWPFAVIARLIRFVSRGRIEISPSLIAVAKMRG